MEIPTSAYDSINKSVEHQCHLVGAWSNLSGMCCAARNAGNASAENKANQRVAYAVIELQMIRSKWSGMQIILTNSSR